MNVALRLLMDRRRSLVWWSAAMAGLVLFTVSLYPSLRDQQSVDDLVRELPETLRTMVGYQPDIMLTSPAGYLNARLFATLAPILTLVFGIGAGAHAIGGAEEDGFLEPLLANPVSRERVAIERYLASVVLLAAIVTVFTFALAVCGPLFGALDGIPAPRLLTACATLFCLALLPSTLAFTVGAITGRRGPAVAIASAFATVGYLLQSLDTSSSLKAVSPWHWYLNDNPLAHGPSATALWLPILASAVLFVLGVVVFRRRDLR
ncbi:ABC transporter permease subunit [Actinomadura rudentiformis]|uniref:ABC transporter permease subunit n=1 Tax=Actinomadura rudentiformis TaxID=359158 RepID=A0A6H9YAU0_9ACTN|nr:ABC transporter permease subunit [Actinomadura rudentiformis]KAB2340127.1 ABC transporter permease subunit [Actinomadura rudentiformis]